MSRSPSAPAMASASCVLPVPGSPRTRSGRSSASAQLTALSSALEVRYRSVPLNLRKLIRPSLSVRHRVPLLDRLADQPPALAVGSAPLDALGIVGQAVVLDVPAEPQR